MKEKPKTRRFGPKKLITKYCCPGKSTEGAKEHRRGCFPPAPDRREEPPGHDSLTIISPEGATEYVTCIITTCLCLCRPFGAFSVVAILPGVLPYGQAQAESHPRLWSVVSSRLLASLHELLFVRKTDGKGPKRKREKYSPDSNNFLTRHNCKRDTCKLQTTHSLR